jgi:hypothetical protein
MRPQTRIAPAAATMIHWRQHPGFRQGLPAKTRMLTSAQLTAQFT